MEGRTENGVKNDFFITEAGKVFEKMEKVKLIKIRENAALQDKAAQWFSQKWEIPVAAYKESMVQCAEKESNVPQWYILLNDAKDIIAGAGVIDNDFHNRKDLSPNLCALYVERPYRKQGIARYMLEYVREDMHNMGIEKLYLVTDHTEFYEKCGWDFLTMVQDEGGFMERMYVAETKKL